MDTLSDILRDVYVSGTVFGRASFRGSWSTYTNGAPGAIFHAVVEGSCRISWDDGVSSAALAPGSIAVVPRGSAHVMSSDPPPTAPPVWIVDLFGDSDEMIARTEAGDAGVRAEIVCGTFRFDERLPNRLLEALPKVLVVQPDALDGWVDRTLRWIVAEVDANGPGSDAIVTRLTDALFVQVVRAHLAEESARHAPWLAAVNDPHLSRAIAAIHAEPEADWTVEALARRAGVSRSALYARFTEILGEPPAQYLMSRRMDVAAHALSTTDDNVAEVARRVGYRSESSFSKAFKRQFGVPPSSYRRAPSG